MEAFLSAKLTPYLTLRLVSIIARVTGNHMLKKMVLLIASYYMEMTCGSLS